MCTSPLFQTDLINRYDQPGPRYTSYPPLSAFHDNITEKNFRDWARLSNEDPIPKPLALYFHIPFCSSICYYCAGNRAVAKRRLSTQPYLQDLHREIEIQSRLYDQDREVRQVHWCGGTPGFLTLQQSQQLFDKIARHFKLRGAGGVEYSIEIDPRMMEKNGIAHLRSLGFNHISLGVQNLDPKETKAAIRRQDLKTATAVIDDARRHGIRSINIDLIYGLPWQTVKRFSKTLDTIIALDPDRISICDYAHLPRLSSPQHPIQTRELPGASARLALLNNAIDKLCGAGFAYIGLDQFARAGDKLAAAQRDRSLQRNFLGYPAYAQCDSIGFGVSSISQVHDNFSQNTISLEAYHATLDQQKLPVTRGFESHEDDLLRRDVIQDLACHFHLDKRQIGRKWNIDFDDYFTVELERLGDMEKDGLLELSADGIDVNEAGRLLVRHICMVFDAYRQPHGSAGLFSKPM